MSFARALFCATSAVALSAAFTPLAFAQEETDEIVVTGTSIRGIAPVGAPVLGFSEEEIRESGTANAVDLLRLVPQIVNIGADDARVNSGAQNANANTMRARGLNIRGLGPQATLTLVDGFRPAPAGLRIEFFDVSAIPSIALGSIEVVADGASAIYGSDAIAGVANLRLRRDFDGAEVQARYTSADGYEAEQYAGVIGRSWDSGDIMFAAEYYRHDPFYAAERPDLFVRAGDPVTQAAASAPIPQYQTDFSYPTNIVAGGVTYATPFNPTGTPLTAAQVLAGANQRNLLNVWEGASVMPSLERMSAIMRFRQEVGPVELYGQVFYSFREFDEIAQTAGTPATTATFTIRNTNPYAAFLAGLPGAPTQATVRYSFLNDFGPSIFYGDEEVGQVAIGARFDLFADWRADVNVASSYSHAERFLNAVNTCGLSGTPSNTSGPCPVAGGVLGGTTLATAFNPFGYNSPDIIAQIRGVTQQGFMVQMWEGRAKMDGTLFTLPGGAVRAALGVGYVDWRNTYTNEGSGQTASTSQWQRNSGGSATQRIASVFGEVVVPVVGAENAMPGVQALDVSLAVRMDDYSLYEDPTTNPKLGLTWAISDGLLIRSSYSTSFRSSIKDRDPDNAPNVVARVNNYFDYSISGNTTAITSTGGNPNVEPETAETYTLGIDWRPTFAPGLNFNATYFNIRYEDIIETSGQTVNTGISSAAQEATYAPFITRRPAAGDVAGNAAFDAQVAALLASPYFSSATVPAVSAVTVIVDGRGNNAGTLLTDGFDFAVSYNWDALGGVFDADIVGTYYLSYDRSFTPTEEPEDRLGESDFPTTYRLRGGLSWSNDNWRVAGFVNYLPGYTNTRVTPEADVDSYTTVDAHLAYTINEGAGPLNGVTLGLNVVDLFDQDPPYAPTGGNQTFDSQNAGFLGRQVSLQLTKRF